MYFKKGKAKIEIAVAKGKKQHDKRATKKDRDWNRDRARYLENQAKFAYLAIGSNLGNRINNINIAKAKLEFQNIKIIQCSSNYESLSWPNIKNPKFINVVIKIVTLLLPEELLKICNKIEKELGRIRTSKNGPRTCGY